MAEIIDQFINKMALMDLYWGQNISERREDPDFPLQPCGMTHRLAAHPRSTFKFAFCHLGHLEEGKFGL